MFLVVLVMLISFHSFVLCQPEPEIVNEIIPEVVLEARLNCTVINKQPGQYVMWSKMTKGKIISVDEKINGENDICIDGSNKYEIIRQEVDGRITFTLVVGCLQEEDYGRYECYIYVMGDSINNWPLKIGYLQKPQL